MKFNSRFTLEMAIDEGSQFNSTPKDSASILGCAFLTGEQVEEVEAALQGRSQLPKWRDATASDATFVVDLFHRVGGWLKVLILSKDNSSSQSYSAKARLELEADRERVISLAESEGKEAAEYPTNPEHLLRTAGVASILAFREVITHHAITSKLYRYGDLVSVKIRLFLDEDSTPKIIRDVFNQCMRTSAEYFRSFQHGRVRMNVRCEPDEVQFVPESSRASLMLVDYLCGIVAATTFPQYKHPNISKEQAALWREELERVGGQRRKISIIKPSLNEVVAMVDKAGRDSLNDFMDLKP